MKNFIYLQDRAGRIHVWDGSSPNKRDPRQRAVCGDPGGFMERLNYNGPVTCKSCVKALGMPAQMFLFKEDEE